MSDSICGAGKSILDETAHTKVKRKMDDDFRPGPYSIIIGRGKAALSAIGNRRLTVVASNFLEKYAQADTKPEKTEIISQIIDTFRDACPIGTFIRFSDGYWWEVSDSVAREKVGHVLRDLLHAKYRSSSKSKVARRRKLREEAQSSSNTSLDSTSTNPSSSDSREQNETSSTTESSQVNWEEMVASKRLSMPIIEHTSISTQQFLSSKNRPTSCPSFRADDLEEETELL